ncbi:MAG: hypothetical protein PHI97_29675 [Desulfobulbus sp.]|nr:hypothetical protein [Desulfobulbus sp.]
MDQIIQNLIDPSWWFTGVFFVVTGIVLAKFPLLLRYVIGIMPKLNRRISRWKERKILLTVKRHRQHEIRINWLIGRYWCLATVTIIYMGYLTISFIISANITETIIFFRIDFKSLLKYLPVVLPAYLLMLTTIIEKQKLQRTIAEHIKWKKNKSSTPWRNSQWAMAAANGIICHPSRNCPKREQKNAIQTSE